MKIDEALYQLKQNIKMHEIEGTTSNQNEREKALLDYITNLQTIEQQYSAILSENAELENKITNLQEENEKEHYLVDKLTRQLNDEYKNTEYQCKQKEDYKSRNEKAIEYIERAKYVTETMEGEEFYKNYEYSMEDLLNILQGSDKDE